MARIICTCGHEFEPPDAASGEVRCPQCGRAASVPGDMDLEPAQESPRLAAGVRSPVDEEDAVQAPQPDLDAPPPSFWEELRTVPSYPFTGSGLAMLISGTTLFCLMDILLLGFTIGLMGWLIAAAYVSAYWLDVVAASASGAKDPPEWPDIAYWFDDVLKPSLRCLVTVFCAIAPAGILLTLGVDHRIQPGGGFYPVTWSVAGLGMLYLPMALGRVAVTRALPLGNVVFVIRAMIKYPVQYYATASLFFLGLALTGASAAMALLGVCGGFLHSPILLLLVLGKIPGFYFLLLSGRVVGLFYWCNQDALHLR